MHAERDYLNRVVFAAIEERLRPLRRRLAPIDLRIGVETAGATTERERELLILRVCLDVIRTSRPFMLVLLGDRYGWVPDPDRIESAAAEAGFSPSSKNVSVTALEIEYWLHKRAEFDFRHCVICIRNPLPYKKMPRELVAAYSDHHAKDKDGPSRVQRLADLKAAINRNEYLGPRALRYSLRWDTARKRPSESSIRAWGSRVERALWKMLSEAVEKDPKPTKLSWEHEESLALEEMVQRLSSSFVGRGRQEGIAMKLAVSPIRRRGKWGIVFTGPSGCGKSALFAHLHGQLSELSRRSGLVLLAHAAGISPRSVEVGWMLRRWISQLGSILGEKEELLEEVTWEDLVRQFTRYLTRVAETRRVVALLDGLNRLIHTERTLGVSWLPLEWPSNARFIATTIGPNDSPRLAQLRGLIFEAIPLFDKTEADALAKKVYARYHRQPNFEVVRILLGRRRTDGSYLSGNPLWLSLSLDLLNLIEEDDFAAAAKMEGGSMADRLRRWMCQSAENIPAEIEGVYRRLLAHVETVVGIEQTRAFATLIALSRNGWQEDDLQHLLPIAAAAFSTGESGKRPMTRVTWDSFRFAVLRRCFRMHLVRRGANRQWDFTHSSLRAAVLTLINGDWQQNLPANLVRSLYSIGADHLQKLPEQSGVRQGEIMWQMLGTRDVIRVAKYFSAPPAGVKILSLCLAEDEMLPDHPLQSFVLSWVQSDLVDPTTRGRVAHRFIFDLNTALEVEGHLRLRKTVLMAAQSALAKLAESDSNNIEWRRALCASHGKLGEISRSQGDLAGSTKCFKNAMAISRQLAGSSPSNTEHQRDLAVGLIRLADSYKVQGDLVAAVKASRQSLKISRRLAKLDTLNPIWQHDLAVCSTFLGKLLFRQNDLPGARQAFRQACACNRRLIRSNPSNLLWQRNFYGGMVGYGKILEFRNKRSEALWIFRSALEELQKLLQTDPRDTDVQREISVCLNSLGDLLSTQGKFPKAQAYYRESVAIRRRLCSVDRSNIDWKHDLGISHSKLGDALAACHDWGRALGAYKKALKIRKRLAEAMPVDARLHKALAETLWRLAAVSEETNQMTDATNYLARCRSVLANMQDQGIPLDKSTSNLLESLENQAKSLEN